MRKTLLFDLDGTLLNTLEDLRDSTNFALRTYGYPERSLEEVRRFVGNGLKMLLTRAVPQGSSEVEIERALACMKAHYCENYHNKTVPYPGIPELLQRLQQAGHIFLFHNGFTPFATGVSVSRHTSNVNYFLSNYNKNILRYNMRKIMLAFRAELCYRM